MGKSDKRDPSDEGGEIIKDAACCEDGCCSWHDNTPAQSEEDQGGGVRDKTL